MQTTFAPMLSITFVCRIAAKLSIKVSKSFCDEKETSNKRLKIVLHLTIHTIKLYILTVTDKSNSIF